jgi:ABC-type branched-subunit amino acid transport system ATPase component
MTHTSLFSDMQSLDRLIAKLDPDNRIRGLQFERICEWYLQTNPKLLQLDEPGEGLSPRVVNLLCQCLKQLNQQGMTIFLAEQNLALACKVSQRAYVIEKGIICYEGAVNELNTNEEVKRKYLAV